MKKCFIYAVALLALVGVNSCQQSEYNLRGKVDGEQFDHKVVYLCDAYTLTPIDSTVVHAEKFGFNLPDSTVAIYKLMLKESKVDILPIVLPVVGGEGVVNVTLGEVSRVGGTPLNDAMFDFQMGVERQFVEARDGKFTIEEVRARFKRYLTEMVQLHKGNILSAYILQSYRMRFTPEEYTQLVEQLDKNAAAYLQ